VVNPTISPWSGVVKVGGPRKESVTDGGIGSVWGCQSRPPSWVTRRTVSPISGWGSLVRQVPKIHPVLAVLQAVVAGAHWSGRAIGPGPFADGTRVTALQVAPASEVSQRATDS
jgi:hypothetical protein